MKKIITLILLLASINVSNAQEVPTPLVNRVNSVQYIFEGKVLESTPYYSNNGKYIRTSHLVEITKILKGGLKCGTVELIPTD